MFVLYQRRWIRRKSRITGLKSEHYKNLSEIKAQGNDQDLYRSELCRWDSVWDLEFQKLRHDEEKKDSHYFKWMVLSNGKGS